MSEKKWCAITGSSGYVGSCVHAHFASAGWQTRELVRRPRPGTDAHAFRLGDEVPAAALAGIHTLVHCAYDFGPLTWTEIHQTNVLGTEKLFRAARMAGVKNIICISTISAYEGCRSDYGRAKLQIEQLARDHEAVIVRPGLVYGRGSGGMFGKLTAQVRKSGLIPLIGDGSQIQYLVHQEDLCLFLQRVASGQLPRPSGLLTAAHPHPWTFRNLLLEIARGGGKKIRFLPLPWRLIWLGLKSAETVGVRLNFRSDSLVSLMYQNPAPDFSPNSAAGLVCRPLAVKDLNL